MYRLKTEIAKGVFYTMLSLYLFLKVAVDFFLLMADFRFVGLLFNCLLYLVMCVCLYQMVKARMHIKEAEKILVQEVKYYG